MMCSFCWMKTKEHVDLSYRKYLTLNEILLMAIPSAFNTIAGSLYYILQSILNDELTIHVAFCYFGILEMIYSPLIPLKQLLLPLYHTSFYIVSK